MRVLQIEDDSETAQTVAMIMKSEGHVCDTADCGEQALDLVHNAEYDIILLDIGLPDIDGYQVLNRLREAGITTPVVIQSGLVLRTNKMEDLGVKDCLAKPFGRQELRASLQTASPGRADHR